VTDAARRRFDELAAPYLDDAFSLARWLSGSATDAEDIVQDACLRLLKSRGDAPVEHPRAFMLAVVRNAAHGWLAKNRPRALVSAGGAEEAEAHPQALAPLATASAEEAMIAAAEREEIEQAIAELPLALRETLVMREVNGLSYREIASALDAPIGTVMSRLARARARLATKLGARR